MKPPAAQPVLIRLPDAQHLSARVDAADERGVTLVLAVPPQERLPGAAAVVEYSTPAGIHRIAGELAPAGRDTSIVRLERDGDEVVQRREFARVDAAVPVDVRFEDPTIALAATVTLNVSGCGALIHDPIGLPMGAEVALELRLDGAPIVAGGRVVRQISDAKGIELDLISAGDRERIVRFVMARQRAELALRGGRR